MGTPRPVAGGGADVGKAGHREGQARRSATQGWTDITACGPGGAYSAESSLTQPHAPTGKQRKAASAKGKRAFGGVARREAPGRRMPGRHPAATRTRKPSGSAKCARAVGRENTVTNYACGSRLVDGAACPLVFACPGLSLILACSMPAGRALVCLESCLCRLVCGWPVLFSATGAPTVAFSLLPMTLCLASPACRGLSTR